MHLYDDVGLKSAKGPGGRPSKDILNELTVRTIFKADPERKEIWRCAFAGQGCETRWAGHRVKARVLKHAAESCDGIPTELRQRVTLMQQKDSLGHTLKETGFLTSHGTPVATATGNAAEGSSSTSQSKSAVPATPIRPPSHPVPKTAASASLKELSQRAGREEKKKRLDFLIMRFVVAAGIPVSALDSQEWKDIWKEAAPTYSPPSATTMEDVIIPHEAANVKAQSLDLLRASDNLTITFDGNTTRAQESVYTVHVTTPDRQVFLMEGHEASGLSHTAEHIFGVLKNVSVDFFL